MSKRDSKLPKDRLTPFPNVRENDLPRLSMVSFVSSIEFYYEDGMSYDNLKNTLDPETGLENIKPKGESLLNQAYLYLSEDTEIEQIEGEKMLSAFASAFKYNERVNRKNFNALSNEDFEIISKELFGLPHNYEPPIEAQGGGGCAWYNVFCHANWLIDTIAEWWNTPAPGDGDKTNGDVVVAVVTSLSLVVGTIIALSDDEN